MCLWTLIRLLTFSSFRFASSSQQQPLEHKWIVRILLQKMEYGLGWTTVLNYVDGVALDIHNANKSLSRLCASISDPEWVRRHKERREAQKKKLQDHQMYVMCYKSCCCPKCSSKRCSIFFSSSRHSIIFLCKNFLQETSYARKL